MKIQRYGGCRSSSPREEFRGIAAAKERRSQVALVSWASFSAAPGPARREWKPKVNGSPVLITRDQGMSLSGWKCLSKFQTRWLNNQGIQACSGAVCDRAGAAPQQPNCSGCPKRQCLPQRHRPLTLSVIILYIKIRARR
jgi:hypothetical protein